MFARTVLICVVFIAPACIALADATPSTQPSSAQPTTQLGDISTPRAMMLSYDALAGAGPDAFVPFFLTHNAEEVRLAHAEAKVDAMLGMLQVMVEKRWGPSAINSVLHAFDSKTRDDIKTAKISVTGDVALMIWPDKAPPLQIVRTADGWKIDTASLAKQLGISVDEYVASIQALSPVLSDIADAIAEGKLATPESAAAEAQRRLQTIR